VDLHQVQEYLRYNAPEMGRLMQRGDKLSRQVYLAYQHCFDHRTDVAAQNNLIRLVEEYIRRDVNEGESKVLHDRLGHKNLEDPILWPTKPSPIISEAVHRALRRRH
jgi:hypothetical protein